MESESESRIIAIRLKTSWLVSAPDEYLNINETFLPGVFLRLQLTIYHWFHNYELLRFSKTRELWSSKANWRLGFSVPSIILTDLLGNRTLLKRVQEVMVCDLWEVAVVESLKQGWMYGLSAKKMAVV